MTVSEFIHAFCVIKPTFLCHLLCYSSIYYSLLTYNLNPEESLEGKGVSKLWGPASSSLRLLSFPYSWSYGVNMVTIHPLQSLKFFAKAQCVLLSFLWVSSKRLSFWFEKSFPSLCISLKCAFCVFVDSLLLFLSNFHNVHHQLRIKHQYKVWTLFSLRPAYNYTPQPHFRMGPLVFPTEWACLVTALTTQAWCLWPKEKFYCFGKNYI